MVTFVFSRIEIINLSNVTKEEMIIEMKNEFQEELSEIKERNDKKESE